MSVDSKKELLVRSLYFLMGVCICAFGAAMFVLCDTGTDPFGMLMQGIARTFGLSNGIAHISINAVLILVILAIDRSYIRIGTFISLVGMGTVIDLASRLLRGIIHSGLPFWLRFFLMLLACIILSLGLDCIISAQIGTGANDLVAVIISDKAHWQFRWVRIAVDVTWVFSGLLLGGVAGVGTIAAALIIGPIAQFFMPPIRMLLQTFLNNTEQ